MMLRLAILLLALLTLPDGAGATTYYVGKSGSDANSCATAQSSTAGNRKLTINAAIACLASGDRLVIGAGTYTEAGTLYETTVSVPNGTAANPTIIEAEGYVKWCARTETCPVLIQRSAGPSSNLEDASYITIRGIIIDDSTIAATGGDNCFRLGGAGDHVVIEDVVFRYCSDNGIFERDTYTYLTMRRVNAHHAGQNPAQPAHGGYLNGDDTYVEDSLFHDNGLVSQSNNIGVQYYCSSANCTADRAISVRNRYYNNDIGVVFDGIDSRSINDLIYDNTGSDGLEIAFEEVVTGFVAINDTIVNNAGHGVYNGIFNQSNNATFINIFAVGNGGSPQIRTGATSTGTVETTNRTTGALTDCLVSSSDFHQKAGSACGDAGTDVGTYGVLTDFWGVRRPQGAGYDIGAGEYPVAAGFTIPNVANAFHASQAQVDTGDLAIVAAGHSGVGVHYGCAVTAQGSPDMTVAVSAGAARIGFATVSVSATTATIPTADATNPRFDLVVTDLWGAVSVLTGTPAANPVYPVFAADSVAVLAAVYVPASDTTIASNQITDKRVFVPLIDTAEVDFGPTGAWTAKTTVIAPTVTVSSRILVTQSGLAATGRQADESEMDALACSAKPGDGSFTLQCASTRSLTHGKFKIHYEVY